MRPTLVPVTVRPDPERGGFRADCPPARVVGHGQTPEEAAQRCIWLVVAANRGYAPVVSLSA